MMENDSAKADPQEDSRVRGVVTDGFGQPVAGIRVQALDRDLRTEQQLGQTKTDVAGSYEIHYTAKQYARAEARGADLVVRAVDADGATLAESETLFNAGPDAVFALSIDVERRAPEFDRLSGDCNLVLDGAELGGLTSEELNFLRRETGWDAARLGTLVRAAQLASDKHSVELLYGLVRCGLPPDLAALAAVTDSAVRAAAKRAVKEGIISAEATDGLDAFLQAVRAHAPREGS